MATQLPSLNYQIIPAGGAVMLQPFSTQSSITITRSISGGTGSPVTVYSGEYSDGLIQIDYGVGQGVIAPLSSSESFIYTITDSIGSYSTPSINPVLNIIVGQDKLTELMVNMMMNGFKTLAIPAGMNRPTVSHSMPINGFPTLPFIGVFQDYIDSGDIPIGQNTENANVENIWTFPTICERHFLVQALCTSADEREFFRSAIIAIFLSLLNTPLSSLGQNIRHSFDSSSSQRDGEGNMPGFYLADVGLSFSGIFNVTLQTDYGVVGGYNINLNNNSM